MLIISFEYYMQMQLFKVFSKICSCNVLIFYSFPQNSVDYAVLGATSKVAAILLTYPFQARLSSPLSFEGETFGL